MFSHASDDWCELKSVHRPGIPATSWRVRSTWATVNPREAQRWKPCPLWTRRRKSWWQPLGRGRHRWMKSRVPLVPVFSRSKIGTRRLSVRLRNEHIKRRGTLSLCSVFQWSWLTWHCLVVALAGTRKRLFYLNLFIFPLCYQRGCCLGNRDDWKEI